MVVDLPGQRERRLAGSLFTTTPLCLIEAPDEDAAESLLGRLGHDAIRVVEVRWVPSRSA